MWNTWAASTRPSHMIHESPAKLTDVPNSCPPPTPHPLDSSPHPNPTSFISPLGFHVSLCFVLVYYWLPSHLHMSARMFHCCCCYWVFLGGGGFVGLPVGENWAQMGFVSGQQEQEQQQQGCLPEIRLCAKWYKKKKKKKTANQRMTSVQNSRPVSHQWLTSGSLEFEHTSPCSSTSIHSTSRHWGRVTQVGTPHFLKLPHHWDPETYKHSQSQRVTAPHLAQRHLLTAHVAACERVGGRTTSPHDEQRL